MTTPSSFFPLNKGENGPTYVGPSGGKSLYIHIPFCKKKCNYCDFVSYAGKENLIDDYVAALIRELTPPHFIRPPSLIKRGDGGELKTIFFGGGTPTLLEPRHFDKIINSLIGNWSLEIGNSEMSVEANPGTVDLAKLKTLRQLGINRLSIGAQSFNDKHLQTLGRIHSAAEIFSCFNDARSAGFDNINLDLIFALPGQTLEEWKTDLQTAISLQPEHISTYNLQIEEGTPFWGRIKALDEELELAMYEYAIETLTAASYNHYEISNFAKPGRECQHNLTYWDNENYLGIGAGAHSHVNGQRWSNPNCVEEYIQAGTVRGTSDVTAQHETLWLGLRLLAGLPADRFQGFEKEVAELINNGLLETSNGNLRLTRQGLYLANEVMVKFI